jgi:hypothetical protein
MADPAFFYSDQNPYALRFFQDLSLRSGHYLGYLNVALLHKQTNVDNMECKRVLGVRVSFCIIWRLFRFWSTLSLYIESDSNRQEASHPVLFPPGNGL